MAVKATDFIVDAPTPMTDSDLDAAADEIAQSLGYVDMETLEKVHDSGPMSAIELNNHENNMLLVSTGDCHPYSYQFNPFNVGTETGLFFDPTNEGTFESFDMTQFVDFNNPAFGIPQA
jgi:hypothetical protein